MDKVKAKRIARRKVKYYKLKTHQATRKRFMVVGRLRDIRFKFKSSNARHLLRNKSKRNRKGKRQLKTIHLAADIRRLKRLLPYYRKMKR